MMEQLKRYFRPEQLRELSLVFLIVLIFLFFGSQIQGYISPRIFNRATTVGYQRLLRFPLASAQRVRLRILGARYSPTIKAVGLYKIHGQPLS